MAASINSESAPENFHISSSNDDSHLSCNTIRCPLCCYSRRLFYCRDCIRYGDFIHSSHHLAERFSEKQSKYLNLKSAHRNLEIKCLHYFQKRKLCENFKTEIAQKRKNITMLNEIIKNKKDVVSKDNDMKRSLNDSNRLLRIKLPKYENNVKKLEDYVIFKIEEIAKRRESYNLIADQLKSLKQNSIEKLIKYIFPITQAINKSGVGIGCNTDSDSAKDTISEISEATRTAYIRGKWILQDSFGELHHVIVAPSLPGNGDYSVYNEGVATNRDGIPSGSGTGSTSSSSTTDLVTSNMNPAFRISAALTYTAQLVQVMCFYLDIRLPYKMLYSDFCNINMTEPQFTRKVARLNANVLYLCYSQQCKLSFLQPTHTLENILYVLNKSGSDLGHIGFVETSNCLDESADLSLAQDVDAEENSESDDENSFPQEWEAVPHLSHLDSNPSPNLIRNPHHSSGTTSMASGLVTSAVASVASFWRGWTAGK